MSFGSKLKQLRHQNHLTQMDMSERLHMEQSNYSHYETDKTVPSIDIVMRVAKTFDVPIDWLIQPDTTQINFESGSANHGAVINNGTNYSVPKDMLDMLISQQKLLVELMQKLIEKQ